MFALGVKTRGRPKEHQNLCRSMEAFTIPRLGDKDEMSGKIRQRKGLGELQSWRDEERHGRIRHFFV